MENTCIICEAPTYSIDGNQETCYECPSGATCYGNWTMIPNSGYWRSSKYSDTFWKCPNTEACIGSPDAPVKLDYTGLCSEGYKGNMCHA